MDLPKFEAAMRRAFQLGQDYYRQADSESYKENAKSDRTREEFEQHLRDTIIELRQDSLLP